MGLWMLMSYRNKKKSSDGSGNKKPFADGSRFVILQDDFENENTISETIPKVSCNTPERSSYIAMILTQ